MQVQIGTREIELPGKYITTELRDSSDAAANPEVLRQRIEDDGYLFIRGLHERDHVLRARRALLEMAAASGELDPAAPLMDAVMNPARKGGAMRANYTANPIFRGMVESPRIMGFFDRFLGEKAVTFDYKWLRFVATGGTTGMHYDIVYMGRGSKRLYTVWTPIGDVDMASGPLAILLGSHSLPSYEKVRQTYGRMDVDRDLVEGWFSNDPCEMVDKFGGRWGTAEFRAGDAIMFGMHMMHASVKNTTNRFRISCDTRYQPAADPMDERWIGPKPKAHYGFDVPGVKSVPMDEARNKWGV